jgi:hypothetical protein
MLGFIIHRSTEMLSLLFLPFVINSQTAFGLQFFPVDNTGCFGVVEAEEIICFDGSVPFICPIMQKECPVCDKCHLHTNPVNVCYFFLSESHFFNFLIIFQPRFCPSCECPDVGVNCPPADIPVSFLS